MKPALLTASNYGPYPTLAYRFQDGVTAIVGPNGSGKSFLVNGPNLALFADGARDLAAALGPFSERLELALEFEHGGTMWRVRRSYSAAGRGKATIDFERHVLNGANAPSDAPGGWHTETRENAAATQAHIERTLGLNREVFAVSAYLAQGDADAFCNLPPAERKARLGMILDPAGRWPSRADRAAAERKAAEQAAASDQARLTDREAEAEQVPRLHALHAGAEQARALAAQPAADADSTLEAALAEQAAAAAAGERLAGARRAKEQAHAAYLRALEAVRAAQGFADNLSGAKQALPGYALEAAKVPALEQAAQEQREAALKAEAAQEAALSAQQRASALETALVSLRAAEAEAARLQAHTASHADATCDRCQQPLGQAAREAALASLAAESATRMEQIGEMHEQLQAARAEAARLSEHVPATVSDNLAIDLARAKSAAEQHTAISARCEQWEREAARLPALQAAEKVAAEALSEAEQALARAQGAAPDTARLDADVAVARDRVRVARDRLEDAHAGMVRSQADLARARTAAEQARELRHQLAAAHALLGLLRLAERAFGRDGIPALIAENTCGVIEAEANRVLEQMPCASGAALRVELRTQRALKTDASALKETLDILVADQQSTREFLTYSGGERFRVSFALRWALARLLVGRRGADSRLLVVDEPDGLDAAGMDGLVAVLRGGAGGFECVLVVSHNPLLAEAFEQCVRVESDGQVSRVAA